MIKIRRAAVWPGHFALGRMHPRSLPGPADRISDVAGFWLEWRRTVSPAVLRLGRPSHVD
jgi:hypothetical protein